MAVTVNILNRKNILPRIIGLLLVGLLLWLVPAPTVEAQSPCGPTYQVVYGDTLHQIAERCDTSISALLAANPGIRNPNLIYTGTRLNIPSSEQKEKAERSGVGLNWFGPLPAPRARRYGS